MFGEQNWLNWEGKKHKNDNVCLAAKMSPEQINEDLVTGQFK